MLLTAQNLPSFNLENYITGSYHMNDPAITGALYEAVDTKLAGVIATSDHFSVGNECDSYIDAQTDKLYADLKSEIPEHEHQSVRINATRDARRETLKARIAVLEDKIAKYTEMIKPLEGLRSQFKLHFGVTISLGLLITLGAMVFDAVVNYAYYQTILLSNAALLWITVIGCSFLSDASMACLGAYISRKDEKFTSKPLYYTICCSLFSMFLIAVVSSIMVRFGSMPETFGTVDAAGNSVAPILTLWRSGA